MFVNRLYVLDQIPGGQVLGDRRLDLYLAPAMAVVGFALTAWLYIGRTGTETSHTEP